MWDDAKALNALAATLAAMAVAALVAATVHWVARQRVFAIREVVVATPLVRASAPHLESVIREELTGTFFSMNLESAKAAIRRVPWVRGVALRRQWPGRLDVAIDEHVPLARWGDARLVNAFGETFDASYAGALPRFAGPDGYAAEIAARYAEWGATLAPLALEIEALEMSPRGGWRVTARRAGVPLVLDVGRDEPGARLTRFAAAYGRTLGALYRQGVAIGHVDLRYRNGFAARVPDFRETGARPAAPSRARGTQ